MRIADLDTSRGDECPSGWAKIITPVAACVASNSSAECYYTNFSTHRTPYSKVCGMALGYHQGRGPNGFYSYRYSAWSINGLHVDGMAYL